MKNHDLSKIRNEYRLGELDIAQVDPDPVKQFSTWMDQAIRAGIEEPTAMTLATATRDGRPSARMVLLKDFGQDGFTFFTNYQGRKAGELKENPLAAMVFYWKELERQVRIEGRVKKISATESDEYFASRPPESQISAVISPQSAPLPDRKFLEQLRQDYLAISGAKHFRPPHWGGYRLSPTLMEFWQGRPGRLHDRIQYTLDHNNWEIVRLAP
jgi:pyridoxamine 5'-phosphate oxidase